MRVEFIYMGCAIGVVPNPSLASYSSYTALRKPDLTITQDYFRRHILSGQAMVRTEKYPDINLRKVEHYIRILHAAVTRYPGAL